jgi:iron complex outermembrane receptor protein
MKMKNNNNQPIVKLVLLVFVSCIASATQGYSSGVLEEVVVTATKQAKSVREIPMTIDAFTGDELVGQGIVDLEKIIELSPGVTFQNRAEADNQTLNIRGIGTSFAARFYNRPYGMLYEDVSLLNPTVLGVQPALSPFDMATVEILKGPQGALFGGSALMGAIRYVPRKPDFDGVHGAISAGYGTTAYSNDPTRELNAMLNLPIISDKLALRIAGTDRDDGGYIDDTRAGIDDVNGFTTKTSRALLTWNITPSIALGLHRLHRTVDQGDAANARTPDSYSSDNKYQREPSVSVVDLSVATLTWSIGDDTELHLVASELKKELTQHRDISGNTDAAEQGNRASVEVWAIADQPTFEARISSSLSADCRFWMFCNLDYMVGYVATESKQNLISDVPIFFPSPIDPILGGGMGESGIVLGAGIDAVAEEKAIFFDINRYFFDNLLTLNIGGRQFTQITSGVAYNRTGTILPVLGRDVRETSRETSSEEYKEFTPKVALMLDVKEDLSFFISAVKGFRYGGFNSDAFMSEEIKTTFDPDEVWNYEMGMRSEWFDSRVRADITLYRVKWDNAQQGLFDTSRVGAVPYIENFGSTTADGVEFNFRALLPHGFMATLAGAYNYATNDKAFPINNDNEASAGAIVPNAPLWTGSARLNWSKDIGRWELATNLTFAYQSASKNSWETPVDLDDIDNVDVSLRISNATLPGEPSLALVASNIENDTNTSFIVSDRQAGDLLDVDYYLGSPRKVTMRLDLKF